MVIREIPNIVNLLRVGMPVVEFAPALTVVHGQLPPVRQQGSHPGGRIPKSHAVTAVVEFDEQVFTAWSTPKLG